MTQKEMTTSDITTESGKQRIWRFPNEALWKRIILLPPRLLGAFLVNGSGPYE